MAHIHKYMGIQPMPALDSSHAKVAKSPRQEMLEACHVEYCDIYEVIIIILQSIHTLTDEDENRTGALFVGFYPCLITPLTIGYVAYQRSIGRRIFTSNRIPVDWPCKTMPQDVETVGSLAVIPI